MKPVRRLCTGWLVACLCLAAVPAAAGSVQAIVVDPNPGEPPLDVWMQPAPMPEHIRIELGVGEGVEGRVLRVRTAPGKDIRHRVQVQFETSAAIDGEGPHIDLLDWKHCRSEWRSAQAEGNNGFRLPTPLDADHSCFPKATRAELRVAVKKALGKYGFDPESQQRWLDTVDQVPQVGEFPSYVAISTVRVRIEQYDGTQWRVLTTIEFGVPMGC